MVILIESGIMPAEPSTDALFALSPLDGRYRSRTTELRDKLSEYGLIHARVRVELAWFRALAAAPDIAECPALSDAAAEQLAGIEKNFDGVAALRIKEIEASTNHDVKAVEYYLKEQFAELPELHKASEFLHFACTSEDINNLAWGLALNDAREKVLLPHFRTILDKLDALANAEADTAMLARTHGQAATPTTLGKEVAVMAARLERGLKRFASVVPGGKLNGATGNFNAHVVAYPKVDWPALSRQVVEELGLDWRALTTQIEPHDATGEMLDALAGVNTVLIDLARDVWSYISLGYFRQRLVEGEVGSSTMPHKVNPIDFENAEGNFAVANALARHLAATLPISRMQRDLTDSTTQRVLGTVFGHTLVALTSLAKGLGKLEVAHDRIASELDNHWEVLGEAAQTLMRKHGVDKPYETLKAATRGKALDHATWQAVVAELPLPEAARRELEALTPGTYTGLAAKLTRTRDHA
jgi:adenylosuccinate lyase